MSKELELQISERKRLFLPGTKVKCLKLEDPYLNLTGAEGIVTSVDDTGTVFASWVKTEPDGTIHTSGLGAVLDVDEITILKSAKVYLCSLVKRGADMDTRKCFVLNEEDFSKKYANIYDKNKNAYINMNNEGMYIFAIVTTSLDKLWSNPYYEFIEDEFKHIDIAMCSDYYVSFIQKDIESMKKGEWSTCS